MGTIASPYLLTQQVDKAARLRELEAFEVTSPAETLRRSPGRIGAREGQPGFSGSVGNAAQIEERAKLFWRHVYSANDLKLAMRTLAKDYGDSYFYYYTFGVSE